MPRDKTKWRLRFSLKSLLIGTALTGVCIGWIARVDREYRAEQALLSEIQSRPGVGNKLTIYTNGEPTTNVFHFSWNSQYTKVVVNYQGPAVLQSLATKLEIPIFDRVTGIHARYNQASDMKLGRDDIAAFKHLETISLQKRQQSAIIALDSQTVESIASIVPPCRLSKTHETQTSVTVDVAPPSSLACCSQ